MSGRRLSTASLSLVLLLSGTVQAAPTAPAPRAEGGALARLVQILDGWVRPNRAPVVRPVAPKTAQPASAKVPTRGLDGDEECPPGVDCRSHTPVGG